MEVKGVDLLYHNSSDVYLGNSLPLKWLSAQTLELHCLHCFLFLLFIYIFLSSPEDMFFDFRERDREGERET